MSLADVPRDKGPASPVHPVDRPVDTLPARCDDFFASLSGNKANGSDSGPLSHRTYDEFFSSSSLRSNAPDIFSSNSSSAEEVRELTPRELRLKDIQNALKSKYLAVADGSLSEKLLVFGEHNSSIGVDHNGEESDSPARKKRRLEIQAALKTKSFATVVHPSGLTSGVTPSSAIFIPYVVSDRADAQENPNADNNANVASNANDNSKRHGNLPLLSLPNSYDAFFGAQSDPGAFSSTSASASTSTAISTSDSAESSSIPTKNSAPGSTSNTVPKPRSHHRKRVSQTPTQAQTQTQTQTGMQPATQTIRWAPILPAPPSTSSRDRNIVPASETVPISNDTPIFAPPSNDSSTSAPSHIGTSPPAYNATGTPVLPPHGITAGRSTRTFKWRPTLVAPPSGPLTTPALSCVPTTIAPSTSTPLYNHTATSAPVPALAYNATPTPLPLYNHTSTSKPAVPTPTYNATPTPLPLYNHTSTFAPTVPAPTSTAAPALLPPPRDLPTFRRILADTSPAALRAAVLAAYEQLPAVQEVFWTELSACVDSDGSVVDAGDNSHSVGRNSHSTSRDSHSSASARASASASASGGDRMHSSNNLQPIASTTRLRLVPRHQVCRHCAEEFDITAVGDGDECRWHYGTARLDPQPTYSPHPQHMYFWDCCGARLSADAPGCLFSKHARLARGANDEVELDESEARGAVVSHQGGETSQRQNQPEDEQSPQKQKRKRKPRARGPTLHCGNCGGAYRENDGGRCSWHDGVLVQELNLRDSDVPNGGRWSCCGKDQAGEGCVESVHVPPRVGRPK
ncbi:hypothetical protein C8R43DRAFT_1001468 [Mycena crocata]|nr:hypothetical protein C8R43DRAFT_1001468 [Mycena crocata]